MLGGGGLCRMARCWTWSFTVTLVCLLVDITIGEYTLPVFHKPDLVGTKQFTDGVLNYRHLDIMENALYVGAMERVYRLNIDDISNRGRNYKKSAELGPREVDKSLCDSKFDNTEQDFICRNHIRDFIINADNDLEVCGTGAYRPVATTLNVWDLTTEGEYPPLRSNTGAFLCPYSPDDNYTCIYVRDGNPDDIPAKYCLTISSSAKKDPVLYREALKKDGVEVLSRTRSIPTFENPVVFYDHTNPVALFETEDYVYIFFREQAVEYLSGNSNEKRIVSRVARICKNDRGGSRIKLKGEWTSYVKARLACTIPGTVKNISYDELQDVQRIGDTFYAVFTIRDIGYFGSAIDVHGSAVCKYTTKEIDDVFLGQFGQQSSGDDNEWAVYDGAVPDPRPGTCNEDSQNLSDEVLYFNQMHPLMWDSVYAEPIYSTQDDTFTHLVAQDINRYTVFYLTTIEGYIHKVAYRQTSDPKLLKSRLVSVYKPFSDSEVDTDTTKIWNIELYFGYLYLGTDAEVKQINTDQCSQYTLCTTCVRDPHCGWNYLEGDGTCELFRTGLYQSVFDDTTTDNAFTKCTTAGACTKSSETKHVKVPGDHIILDCETQCEPDGEVMWYHNQKHIDATYGMGSKYFTNDEHSLVIVNMQKEDEGYYICNVRNVWMAQYNVTMPQCTDPECMWRLEFRQWCKEFDSYKKEFHEWLCVKNKCFYEDQCDPSQYLETCETSNMLP